MPDKNQEPVQEGCIVAGRYRLERPLARGGMGSVWIARHLQLDSAVAMKFMAPEYASSAEARIRFEREAKASAQLKSPFVVQVHDYGVEGETPFLVMELLEGEDLDKRLKRERRLALSAIVPIFSQICRGLRRAHEAGIVHRDLKPGNIFLQRHDDDEIVKILDFGIAKRLGSVQDATRTGAIVGSPNYMSPEQLRSSKRVDHRADLWSLAVILYRCITGKLPFTGPEIADLILQICAEPIPKASAVQPDLNADVDRFFERALDRNPENRFQSASTFFEALIELAGGKLGAQIPLHIGL